MIPGIVLTSFTFIFSVSRGRDTSKVTLITKQNESLGGIHRVATLKGGVCVKPTHTDTQ